MDKITAITIGKYRLVKDARRPKKVMVWLLTEQGPATGEAMQCPEGKLAKALERFYNNNF